MPSHVPVSAGESALWYGLALNLLLWVAIVKGQARRRSTDDGNYKKDDSFIWILPANC